MSDEKTFRVLEIARQCREHGVLPSAIVETISEVAEAVVALQQTVLAHEEELRSGAAGAGDGGGGEMSEERVPTLAQVLANLQDTVLAHEEELKSAAERMAAQEDRLRVIAERLESLGRDRYAAEQLTTVHLRIAALETKLTAHFESIGQMAQKVERLDTFRLESTHIKTKRE